MPADELTRAHIKALKACIEVADPGDRREDIDEPGSPAGLVALAEEAIRVLLQYNPELGYDDPLDQLSDSDRHMLLSYTDAAKQAYWQEDQGCDVQKVEQAHKYFLEWQQVLIERLTR
jgi:hypothetical protein